MILICKVRAGVARVIRRGVVTGFLMSFLAALRSLVEQVAEVARLMIEVSVLR
ncbi:hypothetical protein D3C80_1285370 [compost metagenome]